MPYVSKPLLNSIFISVAHGLHHNPPKLKSQVLFPCYN